FPASRGPPGRDGLLEGGRAIALGLLRRFPRFPRRWTDRGLLDPGRALTLGPGLQPGRHPPVRPRIPRPSFPYPGFPWRAYRQDPDASRNALAEPRDSRRNWPVRGIAA